MCGESLHGVVDAMIRIWNRIEYGGFTTASEKIS